MQHIFSLTLVVVVVLLVVEVVGGRVGIGLFLLLFFKGGKYVTRSIVEGLGGLVGLVGLLTVVLDEKSSKSLIISSSFGK